LAGQSMIAAQMMLAAVETFLTGARYMTPVRG
jgi:hypothetical protein